jgi:Domain of unknown function (DUF4294)
MYKFTGAMRTVHKHILFGFLLLIIFFVCPVNHAIGQSKYGPNDTILTVAVVYQGDTIEAKTLAGVYVWVRNTLSAREQWTRLRNAVFVTYPYAKKAGIVFNDIEKHIAGNSNKQFITRYINSREKELKKEFTDPLTNLSVYQGRILMKLINRETGGTNCYDILKELKGGFTARFWQTVAFFFGSDLKQPYDAKGQDADIETIVKEVQRLYGYSG